jgi:hypothetical protein
MVIGGVTKIMVFFYLEDPFWFWFNIIVYALSWPMLGIGIWWVGKEYADRLRKYASLKFYEQSLMKGTKKAYQLTKEGTQHFKEKGKQFKSHAQERTRNLSNNLKGKIHNIKRPFRKKI